VLLRCLLETIRRCTVSLLNAFLRMPTVVEVSLIKRRGGKVMACLWLPSPPAHAPCFLLHVAEEKERRPLLGREIGKAERVFYKLS
jgi:hypothetical protein